MGDAEIERLENMKDIPISGNMLNDKGNFLPNAKKTLMEQHNLGEEDFVTFTNFVKSMKTASGNAIG